MKLVVVVQARRGSSRLPNKILLPLVGAPVLQRQIERIQAAQTPFTLVVATTDLSEDDVIVALCDRLGIACFRGHPTDLLDRHVQAARAHGAEAVAKIPSDCPLIDPEVIDRVLRYYLQHASEFDYVSNLHPASYPDGNDVEVMSMAALEVAWHGAQAAHEREHTTPYIWDQPEQFRIGNVIWPNGEDFSLSHRFTIDYPEDYAFIEAVYQRLWRPDRPIFSLTEILSLLERQPGIKALNSRYAGVNWYRNHLNELRTVSARETRVVERG